MITKCAAVILRNRKLLVVRKINTDIFISPGGKVEKGESQQECIIREIKEEVGLRVTALNFMDTFISQSALERDKITLHAWFVECTGEALANSEIEEIRWIGEEDVNAGLRIGSVFLDFVIPYLISGNLMGK